MDIREQGQRRVRTVTTGLAVASVVGATTVGGLAYATGTDATSSTQTSSTNPSESSTSSGTADGPTLTNGTGPAHAVTGGS